MLEIIVRDWLYENKEKRKWVLVGRSVLWGYSFRYCWNIKVVYVFVTILFVELSIYLYCKNL